MGDTGVLLAAAGQGTRMHSNINKVYMELCGWPVIRYSLEVFNKIPDVSQMVVVVHPEEINYFEAEILERFQYRKVKVVAGGKERQDSVRAGLRALNKSLKLVAVHDGARPLLSVPLVKEVIQAARVFKAACPAVPVKDTLRLMGENGLSGGTLDRSRAYQVQTPQVFNMDMLKAAYEQAFKEKYLATDDAELFEKYCGPVRIVEGDYANIKITTVEDLRMAQGILSGGMMMKIGNGFDVHPLVEGRELVIGGVKIPWEKGLLGHSDADVLVHAICDALLGAAGLNDIGYHFPDKDPRYQGADSLLLLKRVRSMLDEKGLKISNLDSTIIAEQPRLTLYIEEMKKRLAAVLEVLPAKINIKATTTEGLGFTGRGEGIAAQATVLLYKL